jgi:NTP pyrophosphatase (non-canonical NTP hydrolase)
MTLDDLVKTAHATAVNSGWHDDFLKRQPHAPGVDAAFLGAQCALITSEVSEALEAYREAGFDTWHRESDGKPEGVAYEIADVVIRCADFCGRYGIDLEKVVAEKMAFNATRAHRHGGKKL